LNVLVVRAQQARTIPADAVEVPPRLVPILQLVRNHRQVVRQPQDLRVVLAPRELPGGERVLQQRPRLRQLPEPPPQRGQHPGGLQYHAVVFAQLVAGLVEDAGQSASGRTGIALTGRPGGIGRRGCQPAGGLTKGHLDMLPAHPRRRHLKGWIVSTR
jgi:hypothetical protein